MGNRGEVAMKSVHSKLTITIPAGVTVDIKSRNVVVKGPRGTLTKSFKHMQIDLFKPTENTIQIEKWFALSKKERCAQDLFKPHSKHDHWGYQGLQIPHEDGVCALPH